MTSRLPYMPFYVNDWLADTRHLTPAQRGIYIDLLSMMWRGEGTLPNDDRIIARMVGLGVHNWRRMKPEILAMFTVSKDGTELRQKRLQRELDHVSEIAEKRAQAGRQGGRNSHKPKQKSPPHEVTKIAPHEVSDLTPLSASNPLINNNPVEANAFHRARVVQSSDYIEGKNGSRPPAERAVLSPSSSSKDARDDPAAALAPLAGSLAAQPSDGEKETPTVDAEAAAALQAAKEAEREREAHNRARMAAYHRWNAELRACGTDTFVAVIAEMDSSLMEAITDAEVDRPGAGLEMALSTGTLERRRADEEGKDAET